MAKRNRLEIIRDILKTISENRNFIKITPLLRRSNISSMKFKEYFSELLGKNFIKEINTKDGKRISLTDKGFQYLEKYKTIVGFIEEFEL